MTFSTTADPRPGGGEGEPGVGPTHAGGGEQAVAEAEPAALPPGTMFATALVDSWMRNRRLKGMRCRGSAARVMRL